MSKLIVEVCAVDKVEPHENADKLAVATIKGWKKDELEFACDELGFDEDNFCETKSDYVDCLAWGDGFDKGIAVIVTAL